MARALCPDAALPVVNARRMAALVFVAPGGIVPESFSKIETMVEPVLNLKQTSRDVSLYESG